MESEVSLSYSLEPASGPYLEPEEANSRLISLKSSVMLSSLLCRCKTLNKVFQISKLKFRLFSHDSQAWLVRLILLELIALIILDGTDGGGLEVTP